jgi:hypothetical protein
VTLAATIAVAAATAATAQAATFEVTKRGDHTPGACTPNDCTVREATIAANATGRRDTIQLPSRKGYRLGIPDNPTASDEEEGDLDVSEPVRIVHPGRGRATIDANGVGRVLEVYEENASTELSKLILRGGLSPATQSGGGGGILAYSDLTLIRARVIDNHVNPLSTLSVPGGGVSMQLAADVSLRRSEVIGNSTIDDGGGVSGSNGKITIARSAIAGNEANGFGGGVIGGSGFVTVKITRSTVKGNSAGDGGGIEVLKNNPTTIRNSTISGNKALPTIDSPPSSYGDGGGIEVTTEAGPVTVVNTTIAGNQALRHGGGVYVDTLASLKLNAVTVARNRADSADLMTGNGGGIYAATTTPTVEVRNSLIVLNREANGGIRECAGAENDSIKSLGGNLITTESMGGCPYFDKPSDITDSQPRIGALRSNGGPTQTIALKEGSPAINHAAGMAPSRDQRGVKRKNPDIGAFERR